ncbi:uncharacterized protein KY384_007127 [Bacidia gigantensis]|uniref:uncharacterized protein n=1 Tax=Bacidia gigantensis TaxID=2732470 RepID=UPI001D038E17|nr:uncharacterized protein KY384_007127 [Bacidia gigantensis]KAG8528210.1 hypothetical protein KY384_007127 [Bacidia gigantensis]
MTPLAHHLPYTHQTATDSPDSDYLSSPSPPPTFDFEDFHLYDGLQQLELAAQQPRTSFNFSSLSQGADPSPADLQFLQTSYSSNAQFPGQTSALQSVDDSESPLPPMSGGSNFAHNTWPNFSEQGYLSQQTPQQFHTPQGFRTHKRLSSGSSVASTGPASPYTQSSTYPQIVDTETHSASSPHLDPYDTSYQHPHQFEKQVYFPQPSPLSFVNQPFQHLSLSGNEAGGAMMGRQSAGGDAMAQAHMSNTMGGQRNTRRSTAAPGIAEFARTESAAMQDAGYSPSAGQHLAQNLSQGQTLAPHRPSVLSDLVHQANNARSTSPSMDLSRERSPFRHDSEFAGQGQGQTTPGLPNSTGTSRINAVTQARQTREQQYVQAEVARAYAQQKQQQQQQQQQQQTQAVPQGYGSASNTISPKEALLDYKATDADHAKLPAQHSHSSAHAAQNQFVTANNDVSSNTITGKNRGTFHPQNGLATVSSSRGQTPTFSSSQQSNLSGSFTSMPPNNPNVGAQYPFISQRRQSSSLRSGQSDQAPEFPAHLTSMESTKSDSSREPNVRPPVFVSQETTSSQRSENASPYPRPRDTFAHTNTYVCTAPKCNARFDASAKLQKHRKENHRSSPNRSSTSTTSSSAVVNTQAATNNASRNNAPGPHKCERTNPSTNKPCNTIFSRSYDLTRHEDTIHNNRKQKVRCHLCTEEKTFSRNDALTRHMRVVHPDVDFPSRNRRQR